MGFFKELLGTAVQIGSAFLGTTIAQPAQQQIAGPTAMARLPAVTGTGLLTGRVGGPVITKGQLAEGTVVKEIFAATGGPTGRRRKRTTVETFDPVSGIVTKRVTFAGGVAVRASDVAAFKRVFRQVTKLHGKLPRKTIRESQVKQLTDRVVKNALERAGDDNGSCPK